MASKITEEGLSQPGGVKLGAAVTFDLLITCDLNAP